MKQLEKAVEAYLKKETERRGGICRKWVSPGFTGVPDRIIVLPGNKIGFIEVKKEEGGVVRPRQRFVIKLLKSLGCKVFVVENKEEIKNALDKIQALPISEILY